MEEYTLDTSIGELEISIRLSNLLRYNGIKTVRDLLKTEIHSYLGCRNIGPKSLKEISALYDSLKEKLFIQLEGEETGSIYWKAQNDCYCYGILLKDGTVIQARQITIKGFGWVDVEIETDPEGICFHPFGKEPIPFLGCRDVISIRSEFIAAICESES